MHDAATPEFYDRRFRSLADAMPQLVWTTTAEGEVDYVNWRWTNYTGMTMDQSMGWDWRDSIHPEDLPGLVERWRESIRTGSDHEFKFRLRRASDGSYRWHLGRGHPMRDAEGKIIQWVGTCTDVDDRELQQEELEAKVVQRTMQLAAAKEQLQRVLDGATNVAIIATDPAGLITVFNRGAETMLGYKAEEVVGQYTPEIFHDEPEVVARGWELSAELGREVSGFQVFIQKQLAGESEEREWTYVRKDGSRLPVTLVATALRGDDSEGGHGGEITGFMGVALDLTERRAAQSANRAVEEFAYLASHDLKAPLRVIENTAKWLEEDLAEHLTGEAREGLDLMRSRIKRMERLLDDLLEYARAGQVTDGWHGEAVNETVTVNGTVLMNDMLALLAPGGLTVKVGEGFAGIEVPRMPLEQILMNLVGNAIKHHDRKTGTIEVTVEDDCERDLLAFTVRDDGPGIATQFHEMVFKMFQTLKPRDQVEGSGIGLALVKKHLELRGGTIVLESGPGRGSTFRFTWPKRTQENLAAQILAEEKRAGRRPATLKREAACTPA